MKKTYKIEGIDCAVCAEKLALAIRKIDGVASADLQFLMGKLTVEADDARFDEILRQIKKTARRMEDAELSEIGNAL